MKQEAFGRVMEAAARFVLVLVTLSALLSSLGLLLGIPVNPVMGALLPLLSALADMLRPDRKQIAPWALIIAAAVLALAVLLAAVTVDQGFDSNSYHKLAVGFLQEGWNPARLSAAQYRQQTTLVQGGEGVSLLWAEVNPKATWYVSAVLSRLTGHIESGKALNWLFAFALAGQLLGWLRRRGAGLWLSLPTALLGAFHPVACAQLSYYYLDGIAGTALMGLFLTMADCLQFPEERKGDRWSLLGCWLFWGCCLKASILFFTVTLCGAFLAAEWIQSKRLPLVSGLKLAGLGVLSCGVGGFSPYLTNIFRYGDPLYGTSKIFGELVSMDEEMGVAGLTNAGRFWASLFGRTAHGEYRTLGELLKLPFTFRLSELKLYFIPDPHTGGFGVWFSGLFLLGLALLAVDLISQWKRRNFNVVTLFFAIAVVLSLLELSILPGTYTARYEPQLFGVALYLLIRLALWAGQEKKALAAFWLAAALCGVNMLPWAATNAAKVKTGLETELVLRQLAVSGQRYAVCFSVEASGGMELNLAEKGIPYQAVPDCPGEGWRTTAGGWISYRAME